MGCFRSISTSHSHDKANDFSTPFKARFGKGARNHVGEKRIGRNDDVRPRHQNRNEQLRPFQKEQFKSAKVLRQEYREPGKWGAPDSVKGRGNTPYASLAISQFFLLLGRIFE
jgi:hypothetical protein